MGQVNFYLKGAESNGKCLIYLQFKYQGIRFKYSFGQSIDPGHKDKKGDYKNWSTGKQRVKSNKVTTRDGQHSLNDLMDNLEEVLLTTYRKSLANGIPSRTTLKQALDNFIYQNHENTEAPTLFKLIDRFIANEIKFRGKNKGVNTLKKYGTVKAHLLEFQSKKKYPVNFETINLDFFYQYVSYCQQKKLGPNTIAKDIQVIKVFMNEAFDLGYTNNVQYKNRKFSAQWVDVDAVYLSEKELTHLYHFDFSGNKKLDQVRDLFIFGCCTGLRYSDYSTVRPENIVTHEGDIFLKMVTKKTGQLVIIPCDEMVLKIFDKYKDSPNRLPKTISLQKFNDYIKDACKEAEMKEAGRLVDDPDKQLWEVISSHTARRSFATNLFLQGFPSIEIMKITGHKTEKAFLKYIKVSKLDTARRLKEHQQKKWSEKILRAVA